jgi:hypothetical protein
MTPARHVAYAIQWFARDRRGRFVTTLRRRRAQAEAP